MQAALAYGMGPRASALITGHTDYHRLLERNLAEMHKKEACAITPTGFAANTAFLAALGSIASLTSASRRPAKHEKIAIFSDALNHASIIDGLRMVDHNQQVDVIVYRHNDMGHLDELLSNSPAERKVVYTDRQAQGTPSLSLDWIHRPTATMHSLIRVSFLSAVKQSLQHGRRLCPYAGAGWAPEEARVPFRHWRCEQTSSRRLRYKWSPV